MKQQDYYDMAQDIYDQHFNPKYVEAHDIPHDTEMIVQDYVTSFEYEHISCDGDLLHDALLTIMKEKGEGPYASK